MKLRSIRNPLAPLLATGLVLSLGAGVPPARAKSGQCAQL